MIGGQKGSRVDESVCMAFILRLRDVDHERQAAIALSVVVLDFDTDSPVHLHSLVTPRAAHRWFHLVAFPAVCLTCVNPNHGPRAIVS